MVVCKTAVMSEEVTYRPRSASVITGLAGCGVAFGFGSLVVGGDLGALAHYTPMLALAGLGSWAVFYAPSVTVSPGGVRVRNILRTYDLSWPSIRHLSTRWALTIETTGGSVTAWAAPSGGRSTDLISAQQAAAGGDSQATEQIVTAAAVTRAPDGGPAAEAAALIRAQHDTLLDAGFLDNPRLEQERPRVSWHRWTIAIGAVLLASTVLVQVLHL